MSEALYAFDRALHERAPAGLVGLDEVGRGPLAGPVVAAAVQLDLSECIVGINDSKKLSAAQRERLYTLITSHARAWAVGSCTVEEIEEHNILQASLLAMQRALEQIREPWTLALVDGNQAMPLVARERQELIVEGDAKSASIAAASIVAKVTRDRVMAGYGQQFPQYGFEQHKGYGTPQHIASIRQHGLCHLHRRAFCERLMAQTQLDLA